MRTKRWNSLTMSSPPAGGRGNHSSSENCSTNHGSRRSSFDCQAENSRAVGCLTTANTNHPSSGEIAASSSSGSRLAIGVFCHRCRRWIVIVGVTSRLSERWNRAGSSSCNSATSHLRLVHAALFTDTYMACQRFITNVAVLCGGSCSRFIPQPAYLRPAER